ncbi:MAG: hypothetical protein ACPGWR_00815 [Ardenticatenaceae bacterium]
MEIMLDADRMVVGDEGVKNFVWPLARHELLAMRDTLLASLVPIARWKSDGSSEDAELLSIVFHQFVVEVMGLYQAHAVYRRFEKLGHQPVTLVPGRFFSSMARGMKPSESPIFEYLAVPPLVGRQGRFAGTRQQIKKRLKSIRWNGLSFRALLPLDPKDEIAVTQITQLTDYHARAVPDVVKYALFRDWITPLNHPLQDPNQYAVSISTIEAAIESVKIGFAVGNEELPTYLADYLKNWLIKTTGITRYYLHALCKQPGKVPHRLWVGSGGSHWVRLVGHATRRVGGSVTAHDHGYLVGQIFSVSKMLVDLEVCNAFVTESEGQAESLRKSIDLNLCLQSTTPEIIIVPKSSALGALTKRSNSKKTTIFQNQRPKIKTVMYPSSSYVGDRMWLIPTNHDIVKVDWEARLFSKLKKWGLKVINKPHPASMMPSPEAYSKLFDVTTLLEPFERVMHLADVFIYSHSMSTTFGIVLASDKPVVFIDFGYTEWLPEARSMLKKRCGVVKGWFDEANRAQVNWDELHKAIKDSRYLMDMSFVQTYLNHDIMDN